MTSIAHIRKDYSLQKLDIQDVDKDPITQFSKWWNDALKSEIVEANAMTLATASADGLPSARIVLLKGFQKDGFRFFTNYESYKGKQLMENPRACLVFFWKEMERQVRITGLVEKLPTSESDEYFHTRPQGSRIGAWASPQSEVIESGAWLTHQAELIKEKFINKEIPRPENWGGYLLRPVTIEFWQGRLSRLHDRLQYSLQENGEWKIERLAP